MDFTNLREKLLMTHLQMHWLNSVLQVIRSIMTCWKKAVQDSLDLTVNRQKSKPAKNIPLQITSKISFPRYLLPWDWKLRS